MKRDRTQNFNSVPAVSSDEKRSYYEETAGIWAQGFLKCKNKVQMPFT